MKKFHIAIIVVIALLAVVFLVSPRIIHKNGDNGVEVQTSQINTAEINGAVFSVDISDTEMERNRGLSGREQLATDEGMLFVFEESGIYPFWMKDMNFPIDIVWIGEDLRIVYVKENATPESFPEAFSPDIFARYVLEVNAGTTKSKKFKIGDKVILNIFDGQ